MISVIVPAHNEETVIGRLLDAVAPGVAAGDLEVVVVANGCTDGTADVARSHGVTVLELERGHKPGALDAGDDAATSFPRFYVDADIVITAADLVALARRLGTDGVEAVAPGLVIDASDSSPLLRSYSRYWELHPGMQDSLAGRGCFGVSAAGRARWDRFPDLVADDQFVNLQFGPDERVIVASVPSVVAAPRDLEGAIARGRRSRRGNLELVDAGRPEVTSDWSWLSVVRDHPARLLDLPAFVYVTLRTRLAGRRDQRDGTTSWGVDESSRRG